jgi:hypothetical protein
MPKISASGYQAHTTSPSAAAHSSDAMPASIASRTDVRDDREAPLEWDGTIGITKSVSSKPRNEIFFAIGLDRLFENLPDGQISRSGQPSGPACDVRSCNERTCRSSQATSAFDPFPTFDPKRLKVYFIVSQPFSAL